MVRHIGRAINSSHLHGERLPVLDSLASAALRNRRFQEEHHPSHQGECHHLVDQCALHGGDKGNVRKLARAAVQCREEDLSGNGDAEGSTAVLNELAAQSKKRYFGDSLAREIEARLRLEQSAGGTQTLEWRRYLAGFRKNLPDTALGGGPWLLTYLKVRNAKTLNTTELQRLLKENPPETDISSTFHVEWYRILADRLMRQGAFADAAAAYEKAAAVARPAAKELYGEHARRARYYTERGPLVGMEAETQASH